MPHRDRHYHMPKDVVMPASSCPQRCQRAAVGVPGRDKDQAVIEDSIKVAVRFRPRSKTERSADADENDDDDAWRVLHGSGPSHSASVAQVGVPSSNGHTTFAFDSVFRGEDTTEDVYETVCRPVVDAATSGIDGTIFAYGQTGSGKTFTMQGLGVTASAGGRGKSNNDDGTDGDLVGMVQMAARDVFRFIDSHPEREFLIRTSYVEVYNEVVRDLLATRRSPPPTVAVRSDPKTRGGVRVDATEVAVTDRESLVEMLYLGNRNRVVATTNMNVRSSRSHAIFRITLESRENYAASGGASENGGRFGGEEEVYDDDRAVLVSTLNLVDLAGSESVRCTGVTGRRREEGGKINKSLLALSNVIQSLSQPPSKRPKYVNYRDSKLTRILQPSLSGNARTVVLCCASPSAAYVEETRSTLKFASRAKLIQVRARKNEVMDDRALIRRLQRELTTARRSLAEAEERERRHLARAEEVASVSDARQKIARLKSIILRGGGLRLDYEQLGEREIDCGAAPLLRESTDPSLSASLDPAMWRREQKQNFDPECSSISRDRLSGSSRKDTKGKLTRHLYSVVDMPISDGAMLQLIEEDACAKSELELADSDGRSAMWTVRMERSTDSKQRPTSEGDILREALASKCNANRCLNTKVEKLDAQVAFLRSELKSSVQESSSLKFEKDVAQAKIDRLLVENAALKEQLCLLSHVSFWDKLFGKKTKQNLFECCWPLQRGLE